MTCLGGLVAFIPVIVLLVFMGVKVSWFLPLIGIAGIGVIVFFVWLGALISGIPFVLF